jgi:hypothetical protein
MSELSVGQLKGLPINNNVVTVPAGQTLYAPGHVIQTVSANYATGVSTTSMSFISTGLSASITPKFATSKILVTITNTYWASSGNLALGSIFRDSTNLGATLGMNLAGSASSITESNGTMMILDSPNTTSSITYSSRFRSYNGGTVFAQNGNCTATITLQEIAA